MIKKFIVAFSLFVFFLVGSNAAHASNANETTATWLWDASVIKTQPYETLSFLASKGVNKLYLQVDYDIDSTSYHDFIVKANQKNIDVYALNGSPQWAGAGNEMMYQQFINWVKQYETQYPDSGRFKGIHLDVEPYLLDEWNTDRDALIKRFQDMVMNFKAFTDSKQLVLECDIPFWYHTIDYTNSTYSSGNMAEWIIKNIDGITIMAYRDQADGIVGVSSTEVDYAAKYGKKAIVAVETVNLPDTPYCTFYEEGEAVMKNELAKVIAQYGNNTGFGGTAVHCYDTWKSMKP
jgi:hypothetical protein